MGRSLTARHVPVCPCVFSCPFISQAARGKKEKRKKRQLEEGGEGEFQFQSPLLKVHKETQQSGIETAPATSVVVMFLFAEQCRHTSSQV